MYASIEEEQHCIGAVDGPSSPIPIGDAAVGGHTQAAVREKRPPQRSGTPVAARGAWTVPRRLLLRLERDFAQGWGTAAKPRAGGVGLTCP